MKGFKFTFSMDALRPALLIWLALILLIPSAQTFRNVILSAPNTARQMADYLNANVPQDVLVETWEPEMGFLTNHNYHFPPQSLLNVATAYIWLNGPMPAQSYHYVETNLPPYV